MTYEEHEFIIAQQDEYFTSMERKFENGQLSNEQFAKLSLKIAEWTQHLIGLEVMEDERD
ncbi:hypothetical protein [Viridibacillus sp. FSL H8-0123]|uniref:hypothetical protein n=1 Tax=Viridibacillus sp. FSL H8-0123 TaxID=1928922 RepID=UPI00096ECFD0|nr:hypothetical protein [Viridibacillus sp. FSL H8-0123]OMC84196.1 hypothetical protein BK130_06800 [Viridibacillus sp. FSL H8-0123]